MKDKQFIVRDLRKRHIFRIDNIFFDEFAARIGVYAISLYCYLCRLADDDQRAWPSHKLMSEKLSCSPRQIFRAIDTLIKWKIIATERQGKCQTNVYYLLDRDVWGKCPAVEAWENDGSDLPHRPITQGQSDLPHRPITQGQSDLPVWQITPPSDLPHRHKGFATQADPIEGQKPIYKEREHTSRLMFDYYLQKTGKKFAFTDDRRRLVEQALGRYTPEEVRYAIDRFVEDDWPERQRYLDPVYCFGKQRGKADNLDRWVNTPPRKKPAAAPAVPAAVKKADEDAGRAQRERDAMDELGLTPRDFDARYRTEEEIAGNRARLEEVLKRVANAEEES
jgi:hypothetical protein